MSEHKSVILNGQILHGTDRYGRWKVTQLDGWGDSPPVRSQDVARANADGDFDLPITYGARLVTIGGRVICSSQAAAQQARARITGLVQGLVRAQVMDEGVTSWADVKLTDAVTTKRTGSLVRFQYQLRAPDPRRFGLERSEELTGGLSRSLYHYGEAAASPVVVINGPVTGGYTLSSNDGRQFRVNAGIASGSTHTVDMNDGLLRVNGLVQSGLVGRADIWDIPPGKILNMALVADSGDATGEVLITDTYI